MTCLRKRRRVQFSDECNLPPPEPIPSSYSFTDIEPTHLWYNKTELRSIRSAATITGLRLHTKQDLLDPVSYPNIMHRSYEACVRGALPSCHDFQQLVHWTKTCDERRGLERTSLPGIGRDRMKRTYHLIHTVLAIQKRAGGKQQETGSEPENNDSNNDKYSKRYSPQKLEEMISQASRMLSKPSLIHARLTGIADASAVQDKTQKLPVGPCKRPAPTTTTTTVVGSLRNVRRKINPTTTTTTATPAGVTTAAANL